MAVKGLILVDATRDAGCFGGGALRSLLPVANRPLICHSLEAMARAGLRRVAVVGPRHARNAVRAAVEEFAGRVEVTYLTGPGSASLGGSLAVATAYLGQDAFLLEQGDGLLLDDLGDLLSGFEGGGDDALVLVNRSGAHPSARIAGPSAPLLGLVGDQLAVGPGLAMAGAHLLGGGFLDVVCPLLTSGRPLDHARVAALAADAGLRARVVPVRDWRRCGAAARELLELNRLVLDALPVGDTADDPFDPDVQGRVVIDPSARLSATIVRGPAIIGPRARLIDAYIGPYSAIGPDVCIENAEIEDSIILANASISHVAGRLAGSVVGRGARVFRDFSIPQSVRLQLGDGAEVALR